MHQTRSKDGTCLAFERAGAGAPLILVMGAFNDRATGAPLAAYLAARFTVFGYDRRGRGDSGDAAHYAIEREIEDLEAMIRAAGGSASVLGYSSGAALALQAAASGVPIAKLALYELPPAQSPQHARELAALVTAGRRGDAVEYFQRRLVGIPEETIAQLRHASFRPALEALAHTLVYDAMLVSEGQLPSELLSRVRQPTLAMVGSASPPAMQQTAEALARSLPNGRRLCIEGATHHLMPELIGPVLENFL